MPVYTKPQRTHPQIEMTPNATSPPPGRGHDLHPTGGRPPHAAEEFLRQYRPEHARGHYGVSRAAPRNRHAAARPARRSPVSWPATMTGAPPPRPPRNPFTKVT